MKLSKYLVFKFTSNVTVQLFRAATSYFYQSFLFYFKNITNSGVIIVIMYYAIDALKFSLVLDFLLQVPDTPTYLNIVPDCLIVFI